MRDFFQPSKEIEAMGYSTGRESPEQISLLIYLYPISRTRMSIQRQIIKRNTGESGAPHIQWVIPSDWNWRLSHFYQVLLHWRRVESRAWAFHIGEVNINHIKSLPPVRATKTRMGQAYDEWWTYSILIVYRTENARTNAQIHSAIETVSHTLISGIYRMRSSQCGRRNDWSSLEASYSPPFNFWYLSCFLVNKVGRGTNHRLKLASFGGFASYTLYLVFFEVFHSLTTTRSIHPLTRSVHQK